MRPLRIQLLFIALSATASDRPLLWRDPGPVETLDLAAGPGGAESRPQPPFTFVKEESHGVQPKVLVTDTRGVKWMVKLGEEAKSETFASRIAWAAGYQVRPSYYVEEGRIAGISSLEDADKFIDKSGGFRGARFQMFDTDGLRAVPGETLQLTDKKFDRRELNGLKLTALLVANWDVKPANTAVFEIAGQRYASIADWGASLGDPAAPHPPARKWNCAAFSAVTSRLIDGIDNGFVDFNYNQYAARHIDALTNGIRVEDVKWFVNRMGKLSREQLQAGLKASGATAEEAACFADAIRKRLDVFSTVANSAVSEIRTTTTTVVRKQDR
ncbi:MAG TPA: hypothetical protein VFL57_18450 [Bryobacteraceae bacterium]|nr:hypothetical protein [Bryobacteraceae bacterium]